MTAVLDEAPPPPADEPDVVVLPHDDAAETAVLGAALLSMEAVDTVIGVGLRGEHFYVPRHELIWHEALGLFERGEAIDPLVLADRLRRNGDLGRVGGLGYLHTLVASCPSVGNAGYYAEIVRDRALERKVIAAGQKVVSLGYAGGTRDQLLSAAEAAVLGVTDADLVQVGAGVADDLDAVLDRIESGVNSLATPWRELNHLIGGWVAGNLYIIAAYTAGGKSIAGLQASVDVARRHQLPATYCSLEMTRDQLTHRVIAQLGTVDLGRLTKGGLAVTERDWESIRRVHRQLNTSGPDNSPLQLHVVDQAGMTLTGIRAAVRATTRRYGRPPGIVGVDFLQLMKSTARAENRQVEVAGFAYGLKELALDMMVPVVALAQLNRGPDTGRRKPRVSDLRESGAIEQAADVIILMSRDEPDDGGEPSPFTNFDLGKNRQGAPGDLILRWDARYSRLLDPARDDEGAVLE